MLQPTEGANGQVNATSAPHPQSDTTNSAGFQILGISGKPLAAVLLGWFFVVFDGYDLIVYGTVQSRLIEEWNLNDGNAGTIGSMAFFGMAVGAVIIGRISDRTGRKFAVIASVLTLSIFTTFCAFATNPWMFATFRFIAGLGLGGLVPSVNAMVSDLVPRNKMSAWSTVMMSGVPIGGSIAAILAGPIVPSHDTWGWRMMFLIALVPLVVALPIAFSVLPKEQDIHREPTAHAGESKHPNFGALFSANYRAQTICFTLATFVTLFAWYGLATWLPRIMQTSGYDFGAALLFTLALNLGAVLGSVVTAWAGDRFGPTQAGTIAAAVAGVALLLLLTFPPVWAVYIILILAGVGTHGTQILIIAAIAHAYPRVLRGTALGWAMGVGRFGAVLAPQIAGLFLVWGLGANSNFVLFGVAALISSISLITTTRVISKSS